MRWLCRFIPVTQRLCQFARVALDVAGFIQNSIAFIQVRAVYDDYCLFCVIFA